MPEEHQIEDDLGIEILGESTKRYGSEIEGKREHLQPVIETVIPENWSKYFADTPLTQETRSELENGLLYVKVALDPVSGAKAGYVEVRRQHDNALTVEVGEQYQRRGIASSLITQAQSEHSRLNLLNFAGKAGERLYSRLGFRQEVGTDHFVWEKDYNLNK